MPSPKPISTTAAVAPSTDDRDAALVARCRKGEPSAWTELIQRYQDRLYSVCVRMVHNRDLAADLTQDTFVKVIQGIGSYDGRAKLSTWMIRIAMNVCLSRMRADKIRKHASLDHARDAGSDPDSSPFGASLEQEREPSAGLSVEAHEDRERVLAALKTLEPEQRAVLILCDAQGHSYEEIAEVLGVAVGTVKSRLFRARTALREAVEGTRKAS